MADFTRHQKKIVDRYYEHLDGIMLTKLSELVGELYLADTDQKRDRLWGRVGKAIAKLKINPTIAAHIMETKSPELLAKHLTDWQKSAHS